MAVMTSSPQTERVSLDPKAAEQISQKDLKPETNGHASPTITMNDSDTKPVVNGNGKHDESEPAASPAVASKSEGAVATPAEQAIKSDDPTPAESVETKTKSDDKPASSGDVEMTGDEKPDLPALRPSPTVEQVAEASEPSKPSEAASTKDVEMAPESPTEPPSSEKVNGAADEVVVQTKTTAKPPAPETEVGSVGISQLAIDGNVDVDVSMSDSASTIKVAREREDDASEEPAAKRAKTESQDEDDASKGEAMEGVQVTNDNIGEEGDAALAKLERWVDPENDSKPVTPYQAREFRRVLAGVKKTKSGGNFKDSVEKMWPSVWNQYIMKIETPMDIGELERRLRDRTYEALSEFKRELALIYINSLIFNGPSNEFTTSGYQVVDTIWQRIRDIPSEEPPKSKPAPKQMPSRTTEPRNPPAPPAPARRQSSTAAAASPTTKPPETDAYAVPPGGVPQVRRASTQVDSDRPKRAIHPPKNRDPDYGAKTFNKKKIPLELQFCYELVTELMDAKHAAFNLPFLQPVDPVALQIPNYFEIIKHPMDLSTVLGNIERGAYQTAKQVQTDLNLIFKNCFKFNHPGQPVYIQGQELQGLFKTEWNKKQQWIAKNTPAKADSVDASDQGSEEGSDEENEGGAAAAEAPATNATIQMLERKLVEETQKLSELYMSADNSSETMIDLQQDVLSAIRARLIAEKKKLPEKKPEKGTKAKPAKASKPKAGGAAGNKRASNAAGAKKGGAAGGGAKKGKRAMTAQEKDLIASAMAELDSPFIERAIEIIKKDTGQAENSSGELELEIDQLSNEALHKLWDLCKKSLPNFGTKEGSAQETSPVNSGPTAKQAPKSTKPKKNKPMNAVEQEARIAELEKLRKIYDPKQKHEAGAGDGEAVDAREQEMPLHGEESESSDSEEE